MSESGGSGSSLAQSWFPLVSPVTNVAEREQGGGVVVWRGGWCWLAASPPPAKASSESVMMKA